jgi:hypothetical protein
MLRWFRRLFRRTPARAQRLNTNLLALHMDAVTPRRTLG